MGVLSRGTANGPLCAQPCCLQHLCWTDHSREQLLPQSGITGGVARNWTEQGSGFHIHTHTKQVPDYCPLLGPTSRWLTCPVLLSMELGVKSVGQGDAAGLWSTANSGLLNQTTERSGPGPRPRTQMPRLCTQKPVEGTAQISLIVLSEGQYSEGPGEDT